MLPQVCEQELEQGLLRMQSIAGLREDGGSRVVEQVVADFLAPVRRQAVHEDRVFVGEVQKRGVHLVAVEGVAGVLRPLRRAPWMTRRR